jgi:hypothetical protein
MTGDQKGGGAMFRIQRTCAVVVAIALANVAVVAGKPQQYGAVLLRWKVPQGKAIAFKTVMEPVDPANKEMFSLNFRTLLEAVSSLAERRADKDLGNRELPKELKDGLEKLTFPQPKSASITTILKALPTGNLSVKMIVNKIDVPPAKADGFGAVIGKMMKEMEGTVQLRGEITPSGKVASFWTEEHQRNLVSMDFQLPQEPVRVGDTWTLDVNLITMKHGFMCEKAGRINRVQLTALSKTGDGDTLATIDYCVFEEVKGRFKMPRGGKDVPSTMLFGFFARGEFLVKKGTWKQVVGRIVSKSTGIMTSDSEQHFAMQPMDEVSEALLKLE